MKSLAGLFAMAVAIACETTSADTIKIGAFNLPYRFEDTNITEVVRHVAMNDVIAYTSPTTSFTPPFAETNGYISVRWESPPCTILYRPAIFTKGIEFYIENGLTNCVIRKSLTDAAKEIESELPMRTNLAHSAQQFINSIMDGSITNLPIAQLRSRTRVYRDGVLTVVGETEGTDSVILQNFVDLREHAAFLPLSILDSQYIHSGTNLLYSIRARYDLPNEPSYARSIGVFPLVFTDGYWSLCFQF